MADSRYVAPWNNGFRCPRGRPRSSVRRSAVTRAAKAEPRAQATPAAIKSAVTCLPLPGTPSRGAALGHANVALFGAFSQQRWLYDRPTRPARTTAGAPPPAGHRELDGLGPALGSTPTRLALVGGGRVASQCRDRARDHYAARALFRRGRSRRTRPHVDHMHIYWVIARAVSASGDADESVPVIPHRPEEPGRRFVLTIIPGESPALPNRPEWVRFGVAWGGGDLVPARRGWPVDVARCPARPRFTVFGAATKAAHAVEQPRCVEVPKPAADHGSTPREVRRRPAPSSDDGDDSPAAAGQHYGEEGHRVSLLAPAPSLISSAARAGKRPQFSRRAQTSPASQPPAACARSPRGAAAAGRARVAARVRRGDPGRC